MRTIFIEGDSQNRKPGAESAMRLADFRCPSLALAVDTLIEQGLI